MITPISNIDLSTNVGDCTIVILSVSYGCTLTVFSSVNDFYVGSFTPPLPEILADTLI